MDINYWSVHLFTRMGGDEVKGVNGGYRYFRQMRVNFISVNENLVQLIIHLFLLTKKYTIEKNIF